MSTPNFSRCNSSKIFAYGFNKYYDEETIKDNDLDESLIGQYDESQTECDYEWSQENCIELLKEKGYHSVDEEWRDDWKVLARKSKSLRFCGIDLEITIEANTKSGYYEGAQFDWDADLEVYYTYHECGYIWHENNQYDLTGDYEVDTDNVIDDNWLDNKGLSKIHAEKLIKKIREVRDELIREVEDVFEQCCEHELVCGGIFSNGEAIYYKVG